MSHGALTAATSMISRVNRLMSTSHRRTNRRSSSAGKAERARVT